MKTLLIIATYNEVENITPLLHQVFTTVNDINVVVVDDNSPDKTYQVVEQLIATNYSDRLFLIKRTGKLGLGTAYIEAFNWGLTRGYEIIMHMDADFSHNPKYLPQMLHEIKSYDLVLGSRYVPGGRVENWGIIRKFISYGGSIYSRFILGIKIRDLTGGFKCFRSDTLRTIDINALHSTGYSFQIETTYRTFSKGLKIKEIPIVFEDRRVGQSKMSSGIFIEALIMVIKLRFKIKKNNKSN